MKTKLTLVYLALVASICTSAQQQQTIVDLRTGIYEFPPLNQPAEIPVTTPDDSWKIKFPGANLYSSAYVTTGRNPNYMANDETFNNINPSVKVLAPFFHNQNFPSPWSLCQLGGGPCGYPYPSNFYTGIGDICHFDPTTTAGAAMPTGSFIYRMQFDFQKNCNSNISAVLYINQLCARGSITLKINGYHVGLPPYHPSPDYYDLWNANAAVNSINTPPYSWTPPYTTPYSTTIPMQMISLNAGYLTNGLNSIYIVVNNTANGPGDWSPALLVDASLQIQHTYTGPSQSNFNVFSSVPSICSGNSAVLNVSANDANSYAVQVNPGGLSGSIINFSQNQFLVSPLVSTTYNINITNANHCTVPFQIPITVTQNVPAIDLTGSPTQICASLGQTGFLILSLNVPNWNNYTVEVDEEQFQGTSLMSSGQIYNGPANVGVALNLIPPVTTGYYTITVKDPNGCTNVTTWIIEVDNSSNCNSHGGQSGKIKHTTTGIGNTNISDIELKLYPNPNDGKFIIENISSEVISVTDITGKIISTSISQLNDTKSEISLEGSATGLYFVNIYNNDGELVKTQKISVIK